MTPNRDEAILLIVTQGSAKATINQCVVRVMGGL